MIRTSFLGTRWDIEIWGQSTFGPHTIRILDEDGDPWPVVATDVVKLFVKLNPDDADGSALVEKALTLLDAAKYELKLTSAEMAIAPNNYDHQIVLIPNGGGRHVVFYGDFVVRESLPD